MSAESNSDETAPRAPRSSFPTTQWSLVLHGGADTQGHAALDTLCCCYWYPLYAFVRRQGRTHHEAEDCTQEFLARLLAADGLAHARPERGRFRSFLLTALRNFLTNEWHRAQTAKRGGGQALLPLEFGEADRRFTREPVDPGLTPEQAFDRTWAQGMIERAIGGLRSEYDTSGRGKLFAALGPFIWGEEQTDSIAIQADALGMNMHALTMALHRLRRRLGERLRAEVAETVVNGAEIDVELRHLFAAVSDKRG